MKRFTLLPVVALVLAAACQDSPTSVRTPGGLTPRLDAAETYTVSQSLPIDLSVWVPCAAGGAGEWIQLSGALHDVYHYTINGNTVSFVSLANPQAVSGTGLTTGDMYHGTGVTRSAYTNNVAGFPYESTFVNRFLMIGQGPGNNYRVRATNHVTIDANGNLTASVDNVSTECK